MTSAIITEEIEKEYPDVLDILLQDHSTKKNIVWGTDNYKNNGKGYHAEDTMKISSISGKMRKLIKPRICKSEREQKKRSKDMAEVFTPSWVCNFQNNAVDEKWFGHKDAFNKDEGKTCIPTEKVIFDNDKTWQDYVKDLRLEITCGEAPYLTSRYDATSGEQIPVRMRMGLLDRKLRVINENVEGEKKWIEWAKTALKSVYGFDFQGDNVLLARENLFVDVLEFFQDKFGKSFEKEYANEIAQIISWNIFQMDGMKYVVPYTCHNEEGIGQMSLDFLTGESVMPETSECPGCKTGDNSQHNGVYAKVMDWEKNRSVKFFDIVRGRK